MDEEVMSDDHVGECTAKLSSLIGTDGQMDEWWEIQYEGKPAGHIHMRTKWEEDGGELKPLPGDDEIPTPPPLQMTSGEPAQKQVVPPQPFYTKPVQHVMPTPAD